MSENTSSNSFSGSAGAAAAKASFACERGSSSEKAPINSCSRSIWKSAPALAASSRANPIMRLSSARGSLSWKSESRADFKTELLAMVSSHTRTHSGENAVNKGPYQRNVGKW
jgi:hypothetical protein